MEYMYIITYLKRQKMQKRVKMLISKLHRKEENFFTHHFRSLKCIRFVEKNFCKKWGMGIILGYAPFWGPRASRLEQTGTMHN